MATYEGGDCDDYAYFTALVDDISLVGNRMYNDEFYMTPKCEKMMEVIVMPALLLMLYQTAPQSIGTKKS